MRTASKKGKNDCMVEGLEFSAEESGYEIFTMSNGHHSAMVDIEKLKDLAEEIHNETEKRCWTLKKQGCQRRYTDIHWKAVI